MKICPECQKTYSDDALNFCLDDGANLTPAEIAGSSIPPTVLLNQPRSLTSNQSFGNQTGGQSNWNQNPNQFSVQPPAKKSKGWLWALGILSGLTILCGGGFVGFVFWAASLDDANRNANGVSNADNWQKSPTLANRNTTQKINLSEWDKGDTDIGTTEITGGEFLMSSKKKGYYYVICAKENFYKTENATIKATVRNINEESSNLGYGLVVHSDPEPLMQDYAFLIDSESGKYRVVRHADGEEIVVEGWKRSTAIKDGTQKNVLEVRDENKKMNFYINGVFVKAIDNKDGFKGGVAGLYSGDAVKIAFSDFEISR